MVVLSDILAAVNMADYISGTLCKSLGVLAVEAVTFSALTSSTYGIASMFFLSLTNKTVRTASYVVFEQNTPKLDKIRREQRDSGYKDSKYSIH